MPTLDRKGRPIDDRPRISPYHCRVAREAVARIAAKYPIEEVDIEISVKPTGMIIRLVVTSGHSVAYTEYVYTGKKHPGYVVESIEGHIDHQKHRLYRRPTELDARTRNELVELDNTGA